ncbi:MAG: DUF975 family protein [Lachnospiraceae bacterium]|nr:DUF975 family protein [Lachnospiraceae bacterium]
MWLQSELKEHAKRVLDVNYWSMIAVTVVFLFASRGVNTFSFFNVYVSDPEILDKYLMNGSISIAFLFGLLSSAAAIANTIISIVLLSLIVNPLAVGIRRFYIRSCKERTAPGEIMFGFSRSYKNIVKIMFLKNLYIFLWSMLFIIPGIIKAYEYRMIPYILAENPDISVEEAFALSKKMMENEKLNTFALDLSFLGWFLLGAVSLGICLIFYVTPYYNLTNAELYIVLKQKINRLNTNP